MRRNIAAQSVYFPKMAIITKRAVSPNISAKVAICCDFMALSKLEPKSISSTPSSSIRGTICCPPSEQVVTISNYLIIAEFTLMST